MIFVQNNQALLEKKSENDPYSPLPTFTSGTMEDGETPLQTLMRESQEELGVKPTTFSQFLLEGHTSKDGKTLFPFLITKWEGSIPEKVLDNQHHLYWEDIDKLTQHELADMQVITKSLQKFLANDK